MLDSRSHCIIAISLYNTVQPTTARLHPTYRHHNHEKTSITKLTRVIIKEKRRKQGRKTTDNKCKNCTLDHYIMYFFFPSTQHTGEERTLKKQTKSRTE
jgi:hypothetical protein